MQSLAQNAGSSQSSLKYELIKRKKKEEEEKEKDEMQSKTLN